MSAVRTIWVLPWLLVTVAVACEDSRPTFEIGGGAPVDASTSSGVTGPGIEVGEAAAPVIPLPEQPSQGACVATECPSGYASCPDAVGRLPRYACQTTLASDNQNCGACGVACPVDGFSFNAEFNCVDGQCRASCLQNCGDCNGIVDDGCEVCGFNDDQNCGACGNVCPAGTPCIGGTCGCPNGTILCGTRCVDVQRDAQNCGTCDYNCESNAPADAAPLPPNMTYGCTQAECRVVCSEGNGDCNANLDDGCEVSLIAGPLGFGDPNHCGRCDNVCQADEKCFEFQPNGSGLDCQCRPGETICDRACADLENDPANCGGCGVTCEGLPFNGDSNTVPVCRRGRCAYDCLPGFSDCNGLEDGCETEPLRDPRNCGGCGVTCDLGAGQPCFNGQCLMQDCGDVPR